jgi:hypothetical protein
MFSSCSPIGALYGGQRDPAHRAALLVLGPAGSGQVAAHDALDRQHLQPHREHGAVGDLGGDRAGDEVVGDRIRTLREPVEPPSAEGGEQRALVGDPRLQREVEGAHAVGGDDQQAFVGRILRRVQVADLAGIQVTPAGEFEGGAHRSIIPAG